MSGLSQYSTTQLILRSLQPSAGSAFLCLGLAAVLVGVNVVLQSVDVGTSLPGLLDGQWAIYYTDHVVQPLTELLSSNTLNKFLVAALWGLAGFIAYVGFEYAVHSMRSVRENRSNIRMARGNVVEHPLQRSFLPSLAWHIGVIVIGIVFLIAVQPLLRNALGVATAVVLSQNLVGDGIKIVLAVAEWTFVLHGLVVFLRLYTTRTRLFGDSRMY